MCLDNYGVGILPVLFFPMFYSRFLPLYFIWPFRSAKCCVGNKLLEIKNPSNVEHCLILCPNGRTERKQ